ncbi:MAG: hypothetical protein Q9192_002487 [Flavoplaca navasiana]
MAAADCFAQVGDRYTKSSIVTHRISIGIECPPSGNNVTCPLEVEGFIQESATLNITTQFPDDIFEAVKATTDRPFNSSITGLAPNLTYSVEPGSTGYYGFTVTLGCFDGTLGECDGGDVEPGTPIEACTPLSLAGGTASGIPTLDGTGGFVSTDDESISNMTTNPSATAPPETEETEETEETQESMATSGTLRSGVLILVTFVGLLWCAI